MVIISVTSCTGLSVEVAVRFRTVGYIMTRSISILMKMLKESVERWRILSKVLIGSLSIIRDISDIVAQFGSISYNQNLYISAYIL